MIDPLADLQILARSYDFKRKASVYFDWSGEQCWAKAWFNDSKKGEKSIEIPKTLAIKFINGSIDKDAFLSRLYPSQMKSVKNSLEEARRQMLNY